MGKREIVKKKRQQKKKQDITLIVIITVVAIVAVGLIILSQYKPVGEIITPDQPKADIVDGLTMGSPDAPVKVTEFADFQCPYCALYWAQYEPDIINNYVNTGKAQFTYSPFSFLGTSQTWDESVKSAEAAYCANDQGMFWEYRDYINANHNGENQGAFSRERLLAFAKKLNLDSSTFKECLDSDKYYQQVQDANSYASEQGVNSTPSFIVNGQIVSAPELAQAIEDALAK